MSHVVFALPDLTTVMDVYTSLPPFVIITSINTAFESAMQSCNLSVKSIIHSLDTSEVTKLLTEENETCASSLPSASRGEENLATSPAKGKYKGEYKSYKGGMPLFT
ncbi:UNVERIFIED_CONTAM: hypothetical protein K2H54_060313 [Gekko kuhli]